MLSQQHTKVRSVPLSISLPHTQPLSLSLLSPSPLSQLPLSLFPSLTLSLSLFMSQLFFYLAPLYLSALFVFPLSLSAPSHSISLPPTLSPSLYFPPLCSTPLSLYLSVLSLLSPFPISQPPLSLFPLLMLNPSLNSLFLFLSPSRLALFHLPLCFPSLSSLPLYYSLPNG